MGRAVLDYWKGDHDVTLLTETSISEPDAMEVAYFFREFKEMPYLEQRALQQCSGRVLDAGCGTGSHALYLQEERKLEVVGIELSAGCAEVATRRGVTQVWCTDLFAFSDDKGFDTILMLMNGSGILGSFSEVTGNLRKLKELLTSDGSILIDSSDLIYMFDEDEDGGKWVPGDRYYGELEFTLHYQGETESFPWLYLDFASLQSFAEEAGYNCELLETGQNYDYLAKLSLRG